MTLEIGGRMPEVLESLLPQSGEIFRRDFQFHRPAAGTKYESNFGFL
jgi:hypothetical protein